MALVGMTGGEPSLAQTIQFEGDEVSLQVFDRGKWLSTQACLWCFPAVSSASIGDRGNEER